VAKLDGNFNALISLIKDKKAILNSIHLLTLLHEKLIREGNFEGLNTNLGKRQLLIEKLQTVNEQIKLKQKLFNNEANSVKQEELNSLDSDVFGILKEICDADKNNEEMLNNKREELKTNIRNNNIKKKSFAGYQMINTGFESIYFDENR